MTGSALRDKLRTLTHEELVAVLVALCSGLYPRAASDSVLMEIEKRLPD